MTDDEKSKAADGAEFLCRGLIQILEAHGADGVSFVLLGSYIYGLAEGARDVNEHFGTLSEDGTTLVELMPVMRERGRERLLEAARKSKGDA
jgi:hypothetical protein